MLQTPDVAAETPEAALRGQASAVPVRSVRERVHSRRVPAQSHARKAPGDTGPSREKNADLTSVE